MSAASAGAAIRHQQFLGLPATRTDDNEVLMLQYPSGVASLNKAPQC